MAKCKQCGKRGLFLQLNYYGLCEECQRDNERQKEEEQLARIQEIDRQIDADREKFRKEFFPVVSSTPAIQSAWDHWPSSLHDTDEQLRLQVKAKFEVPAVLIQPESCYGIYSNYSGSELYSCNLTSCTCDKFRASKKPCEHIYRLFWDMNHIELLDYELVWSGQDYQVRFLSLPKENKKDYIDRIRWLGENGRDSMIDEAASAEIEAGLFSVSPAVDYTPLLERKTKDELILALAKKSIQGYRPSWSKVRLIAWIIEEQKPFLEKAFPKYAHITAPKEVLEWAKAIDRQREKSTVVHPWNWREVIR